VGRRILEVVSSKNVNTVLVLFPTVTVISKYAQGKTRILIRLLHFVTYNIITVQNVRHCIQYTLLFVTNKSLLPVDPFLTNELPFFNGGRVSGDKARDFLSASWGASIFWSSYGLPETAL
jgi:hypothetical protein